MCANLSAAQVKAFRERLEGKDEEELRTLSSNPSSARDSVEDGLSANAQKSLKRCLVADPVRSNFYKNQFWALKEREELAVGDLGDFFPGMIVGKLNCPDRKERGEKKGVPNSAKFHV